MACSRRARAACCPERWVSSAWISPRSDFTSPAVRLIRVSSRTMSRCLSVSRCSITSSSASTDVSRARASAAFCFSSRSCFSVCWSFFCSAEIGSSAFLPAVCAVATLISRHMARLATETTVGVRVGTPPRAT